jgi:CDP-diglyceride synthetase
MLIAKMYIALISPIISGIINSIFCKTKYLNSINKPIDFGKNFIDKKRILGDHKTWKGFLGYIVLNVVFAVTFGALYSIFNLDRFSFIYQNHENNL